MVIPKEFFQKVDFEENQQTIFIFLILYLGADINNICNEAAINAARETRKSVLGSDLDMAIERVQAGKLSTLRYIQVSSS